MKIRWYKRHVISYAVVDCFGAHACFARPLTRLIAENWLRQLRRDQPEGRPYRVVRLDGFVMAQVRPRKER